MLMRVYISLSSKFACLSLVSTEPVASLICAALFYKKPVFCTDAHIPNSISGIEWVADHAKTTGRPSVAFLGIGAGFYTPIQALDNLVSSGVTAVVPAGNDNTDAYLTYPANQPSVITVGASTIADTKAGYSNYGAVVDIWAPGMQELMSRSPKPSHPFA